MVQEETIANAIRSVHLTVALCFPSSHAASAAFMICASFCSSWKESPGSTYVALNADIWAADATRTVRQRPRQQDFGLSPS